MRAVVQRVSRASVTVEGQVVGRIGRGFLVLMGAAQDDTEEDSVYLARKTSSLRVFEDQDGKMNLSLAEVSGQVLAVSQFTLLGTCHKGRRPAFTGAMAPEPAKKLYEHFVEQLRGHGLHVETGVFQAMMDVELVNDGPVTLLIDSTKKF